jgi:hypothetical protein
MKTATLTKEQKSAVAKIITGAIAGYQMARINAKSPNEREFYEAQIAEAAELAEIFKAKGHVAVEDEDDNGEEEDDEEEGEDKNPTPPATRRRPPGERRDKPLLSRALFSSSVSPQRPGPQYPAPGRSR